MRVVPALDEATLAQAVEKDSATDIEVDAGDVVVEALGLPARSIRTSVKMRGRSISGVTRSVAQATVQNDVVRSISQNAPSVPIA